MIITTQEKERAFDDLHRIAEQLETISRRQDAAADALENIAAALCRAYPERIRPAEPPRAAGELPSSESSGAAPELSDAELLGIIKRRAAQIKTGGGA